VKASNQAQNFINSHIAEFPDQDNFLLNCPPSKVTWLRLPSSTDTISSPLEAVSCVVTSFSNEVYI
jgi:hypothetical protein